MPSADFYKQLLYYLSAEVLYYVRRMRDPSISEDGKKEALEDVKKAVDYVKDRLW